MRADRPQMLSNALKCRARLTETRGVCSTRLALSGLMDVEWSRECFRCGCT